MLLLEVRPGQRSAAALTVESYRAFFSQHGQEQRENGNISLRFSIALDSDETLRWEKIFGIYYAAMISHCLSSLSDNSCEATIPIRFEEP